MNKILFLLCFCLLFCGCGKKSTDNVEGTEPSTNSYATYIQKNNRTVRVKNFDKVLLDTNAELPTDEYVRYGLFYESYATPDEIARYEYVYSADIVWDENLC